MDNEIECTACTWVGFYAELLLNPADDHLATDKARFDVCPGCGSIDKLEELDEDEEDEEE